MDEIRKKYFFYIWDTVKSIVRLMTSFDTTEEDIDGFLRILKKELKELSLLFEISRILDSCMDLRDIMRPVLKAILNYIEIIRCAITLLNRKTGEISIESAVGLSTPQQKRGRYKLGEWIVGNLCKPGNRL